MKATLNIKTNSIEDRSILLGVLYALGAVFHRVSAPGVYDLEEAKKAYKSNLTLSIDRSKDGLDIQGWNTTPDANFSEEPAKAIALIKEFAAEQPKTILIQNVGDYEAEVKPDGIHIYDQIIDFDKFDEIAAAVNKLNK